MGAYAATLRHTPDHEDLVTATDSALLYRVVGRWMGQGGKSSLANTADADILEYILTKLAAREGGRRLQVARTDNTGGVSIL
jgi:hypothetical protein